MFGSLTTKERETLAAKLRRASVALLHEYDALSEAPDHVNAAYGLCPGGECHCIAGLHLIPTDWLMACVDSGRLARELESSQS